MFGIKTMVKTKVRSMFSSITHGKLFSDVAIRYLMEYFKTDIDGHKANIDKADLGYGWIHYAFIRTIKPKRILCIGSRHGYIPAVLAQGCKDNNTGRVDFVDPGYGPGNKNYWTGNGYWKTEKGLNCFNKFGLNKWIKVYVITSKKFCNISKAFYDYIYIDGDHSYKGVNLDYELFWPKLRKKGFMVFHDVCITKIKLEGKYGVNQLWNKLSKNYHSIIFPFEWSGLGIVQKV